MAARTQARAVGRSTRLDPFHWIWALLCNVKFALVLVGLAGLAALVGVVVPQVPPPMRGNPPARAAWIELRREDFGALTDIMDGFELFDVFHAPWFYGLWLLIIAAVTVCTVSRFRPTARAVRRPQRVVPDRYFETAHHRADFSHPGGVAGIESALRKRRYRVEHTHGAADADYLFAQRYQWSSYGTFLSHLALLMLLVGGLLTRFAGFQQMMVIAETKPAAPVFASPGPNQMFIEVKDAYRGLDEQGNIIDFHTLIEVRRATETTSCKTTVNDPCEAFGYRIHQAAWFNDIARLRIVGPSGAVVFEDTLDFESQTTAVPSIVFEDLDGNVRINGPVPQMATDPGASSDRDDDVAISVVATSPRPGATGAEESEFLLAWRVIEGELRVALSGGDLGERRLRPGDEVALSNGTLRYNGPASIPAIRVDDMPGTEAGATVQMFDEMPGQSALLVSGLDDGNVVLRPGEEYVAGNGYRYVFSGRVEASGLDVRRDPGDTFIWVAVGMGLIGLGITFYVPRRRLWVKVTPSRTYIAGIAERTTLLSAEFRRLGEELGSADAHQLHDRPGAGSMDEQGRSEVKGG